MMVCGRFRTGLKRAKNQRRLSMKSARKPAVIARSRNPNGSRAGAETDETTTNTRSRKIATSPKIATTTSDACRCGGRPVSRLSRYANGISHPTHNTHHARVIHGWTNTRWTKNRVSTGTLPYQITMYCDQKKYIQRMDIANCSLATSWTADGGMEARPRALARMVKIDRRQNAVQSAHTAK